MVPITIGVGHKNCACETCLYLLCDIFFVTVKGAFVVSVLWSLVTGSVQYAKVPRVTCHVFMWVPPDIVSRALPLKFEDYDAAADNEDGALPVSLLAAAHCAWMSEAVDRESHDR
jgi:hypothetical protein